MSNKNIKNMSLIDNYLIYLNNIVDHFQNHTNENISEFKDEIYNCYNIYVYISENILHLVTTHYSQLKLIFTNDNLVENIINHVNNYKDLIYKKDYMPILNFINSIDNKMTKILFFCELFFPYDFYLSLTKFFEYYDEITLNKVLSTTLNYERNFFIILKTIINL